MPAAMMEQVGEKELAKLIPSADVSAAQKEGVFRISYHTTSEISPALQREIEIHKEDSLQREEVDIFLAQNPKIKRCIPAANAIIQKYFPDGEVLMEVVQDPDSETESTKTLFLCIFAHSSPKKALASLEKVDEEIFGDGRIDAQLFNINLKFQK